LKSEVDETQEGAFDEAAKGVDAIVHTASPAHWNAKTPAGNYYPKLTCTKTKLKVSTVLQ
jgi:hypothetical protein